MQRNVSMPQANWNIVWIVCLEQVEALEREGNHELAEHLRSEVLPAIQSATGREVQLAVRG